MRINNLAKAILFPMLMVPLVGTKAEVQKSQASQTRVVPKENLLFPEIDPIAVSTLALPRNIDPLSLSFLVLSKKFDNKHYITEVITDPDKSWDYQGARVDTLYKVDTKNKGWFYIARYKYSGTDTAFAARFDQEHLKKGLVFPRAIDKDTPVATVSAREAGLNGTFEVYEIDNWYYVKYKFSPLLYIPNHTSVSSTYLVNLENVLRKLPSQFTSELAKQNIQVMTGWDHNDVYYYYHPSWQNEDAFKPHDPTKPAYEITENGYIDRRKHMHVGGYFLDNQAVMPQHYVDYYTSEFFDYTNNKEEIMRVLSHELGHALDYAYSSTGFSSLEGFQAAHTADTKTFSEEDKKKLVYFYNSRIEAFAELTGALLGGFTKERAAIMLHKFPKCAEFVREDILPRIKVNISIEQIRRDIYPNYLKKDEQTKSAIKRLSRVLTIPDMPALG